MREFLHGWRRKAGCVTLVMALVLTAGWFRSWGVIDAIEFAKWDDGGLEFGSDCGSLFLRWTFYTEPSPPGFKFFFPSWSSWKPDQNLRTPPQDTTWSGGGIRYTRKVFDSDDQTAVRAISIPYWYFLTPLTFLSAYLILRKPRRKLADQPANLSTNSN